MPRMHRRLFVIAPETIRILTTLLVCQRPGITDVSANDQIRRQIGEYPSAEGRRGVGFRCLDNVTRTPQYNSAGRLSSFVDQNVLNATNVAHNARGRLGFIDVPEIVFPSVSSFGYLCGRLPTRNCLRLHSSFVFHSHRQRERERERERETRSLRLRGIR